MSAIDDLDFDSPNFRKSFRSGMVSVLIQLIGTLQSLGDSEFNEFDEQTAEYIAKTVSKNGSPVDSYAKLMCACRAIKRLDEEKADADEVLYVIELVSRRRSRFLKGCKRSRRVIRKTSQNGEIK